MSKKHCIALADYIIGHNRQYGPASQFGTAQLNTIADFCRSRNPAFDKHRWLDYIAGTNGPSGGKR